MLPVHWGTFNLALHAWDEPAETLLQVASERRLRVLTPRLGQVFEPLQVERLEPWWRRLDSAAGEPARRPPAARLRLPTPPPSR